MRKIGDVKKRELCLWRAKSWQQTAQQDVYKRQGVKSGLLAGGIGILVALAVLIVGKPLISLVFGVKYLEAYDLIPVSYTHLLQFSRSAGIRR